VIDQGVRRARLSLPIGFHVITKPLVRCPACESTLIYPVACLPWKRQSLVERRCPDCEHCDVVITHRLAAAVWLRRGKSAADDLHALADALADGLELEIDWPASER
jgi:ribosomal protein S27E